MSARAFAVEDIVHRMIPVRDGCRLAARIWMPVGKRDPVPAVIEMLPYRKSDRTVARDATTHPEFAASGYACLRVDLRGCGDSEGLFDDEYSEQELSDIEDVIAWIAAQDWSSGAVGIMGISWGGFNGLQTAARRPAALKAVISVCSSTDRFADDIHYKGGCELSENIGWAATVMSWFSMPPDPLIAGNRWRETWLRRLENTPFLASGWTRHRRRDAYWRHGSVCEDFSAIEAPVLVMGGWHDGYRNTSVKLLEGGTSGPVKAIMGPWNHKYPHLAKPEPRADFVAMALRWWDRWLKNIPNGAETDPDYSVYVMDAVPPQTSYSVRPGRWLGIDVWPKGGISHLTLTLGDAALGKAPMSGPASIAADPACGQATGEYFPFGFGPGELPGDQQADDARALCFDSAPLEDAMTVLGAPVLRIDLASDRTFGQIAARLSDVAPDGRATLISHGFLNLQFHEGFETARPLVPGRIFEARVDLDHAAYKMPAGHRLRLALSPGYWPFVWPERGQVSLTVASGDLRVPLLPIGAGRKISFPAAPENLPEVAEQTRPVRESKDWSETDAQFQLTIEADHGETLISANGLRMASSLREVWSIDKNDIAKATAEIFWQRSLARGEWAVSTEVKTLMRSDAENVHVTMWIDGYEHDRLIFTRKFHDTVTHNGDTRHQQD